jgi:hypothetical protein
MKVYEVRDISNDEIFFIYGFYSTKEKAVEVLNYLQGDINDFGDDFVTSTVIEHELDSVKKTNEKIIIEKTWEKFYDDTIEEYLWIEKEM